MGNKQIKSKSWSVDVAFFGLNETYEVSRTYRITEEVAKEIALWMYIKSLEEHLRAFGIFELTPTDPDFTHS